MSWQEREMLRREALPYSLADRAAVTPFVAPNALERPIQFKDEWNTQRRAVQPAVVFGSLDPVLWPLDPDPINESAAGTYYTNWIDLDAGPSASGMFSCPESSVRLTAEDAIEVTVSIYLEVYDVDDAITSKLIADLTSDGTAKRSGNGQVAFQLTGGKLLTKVRYKLIAGAAVYFSSSGSLIWYGSV